MMSSSNEINTTHHHIFTVPQHPMHGYLAEHLRIMESRGWRVVATTVHRDELLVAMTMAEQGGGVT
jgi:hypothetical protein